MAATKRILQLEQPQTAKANIIAAWLRDKSYRGKKTIV